MQTRRMNPCERLPRGSLQDRGAASCATHQRHPTRPQLLRDLSFVSISRRSHCGSDIMASWIGGISAAPSFLRTSRLTDRAVICEGALHMDGAAAAT